MARTASIFKPDSDIEGVAPQDIRDDCIEARHIGDGEVLAAALASDAIDGTKIADNSIDSEHYVDGSIDKAHLSADCVDGTKIEDDSIDSEHYVDGSIDNAHLADDAVDSDELASGAVDADHVGLVTSNVAVPIVITLNITTGSASEKIFDANAPFKFEILDVIIQPRGASTNGTMKLTDGTNDITDAMTCAVDQTIARASTIDDAYSQIAASGTLEVVCAGDTVGNTIGLVTIIAQKVS